VRVGPTLAESRKLNPADKEIIGRVAAELVEPDDILMIDGGFTTYQVARQITAANISVVTNSFDVAQALVGREGVTLVILGGELSVSTGTTIGPTTEQQILQLGADKAILGADAISPDEGLSSPIALTSQTKKAMISRSREVIIVADHTKLGKVALYGVAPVESITTLVTDIGADQSMLDEFRAAGIEVIVAS
jgi:DeoR family fructose operon transcriptional repressor